MPTSTLQRVLTQRLATQRVTSAGLAHGGDVVRLLTCVQSQDAPLAAWSIGLRSPEGTSYADVLAAQSTGAWLRTHILRPTWHLVAPEDLRWVQALTGPKVEASAAGRRRGLGLDDRALTRALDTLREVLAGPTPLTRREVTAVFLARGLPASGEQVAHQLIVAELRSVICSRPPRGATHTYVLADESVPSHPLDDLAGSAARRALVQRFVRGHGPVSERDLARWCTLTLKDIRVALADLARDLDHVDLGEHRLWFDPTVPSRSTRPRRSVLLPTFDEASLTYTATGFPRRVPSAERTRLVAEAGGGIIVLDGEDVGTWKRTLTSTAVRVVLRPDSTLTEDERGAVAAAAEDLARFVQLPLDLTLV